MNFKQRRTLLKTFIETQFGYCPLIQMFHSRRVNNRINHLYEHSLRIVYKGNYSSYVDLLAKGKQFTIHQRNIQSLAIELFTAKRNLSNYFALKVWDMIPSEIDNINSLQKFKTEIRNGLWKTCYLCRPYIYRIQDLFIWFNLLICLGKLQMFVDILMV